MSTNVQIKFTSQGWSAAFGSFGPGDLLRCSPEAARHFVHEAKCASYVEQGEPPAADAAAAVVKKSSSAKAKASA